MESLVHLLQKKFFREVQFPTQEEPPHTFDLIIDPKRYEEAPHHTYNAALYQRLETLEYLDRVAFLEYQCSLYENPMQWLESLTGLIRSLSFSEWFSLSDSVDQYLHIIRQLHERYKAEITLAAIPEQDKLIWRIDPGVFFCLFSALHSNGAFNKEKHGLDQMKVAEMLYQSFEVKTKRKSGKPFSLSTFKQNFKRTSNLQNSHDYIELNKAVDQFIKRLKELDLLK